MLRPCRCDGAIASSGTASQASMFVVRDDVVFRGRARRAPVLAGALAGLWQAESVEERAEPWQIDLEGY